MDSNSPMSCSCASSSNTSLSLLLALAVLGLHARTHTVRNGAAGMVGSRTECTLVLRSPVWLGDSQSLSRFAALHSSVSAH